MLSDRNVLRATHALPLFSKVMHYYNLQVTGEDDENALSDLQISVSSPVAESSLHPSNGMAQLQCLATVIHCPTCWAGHGSQQKCH